MGDGAHRERGTGAEVRALTPQPRRLPRSSTAPEPRSPPGTSRPGPLSLRTSRPGPLSPRCVAPRPTVPPPPRPGPPFLRRQEPSHRAPLLLLPARERGVGPRRPRQAGTPPPGPRRRIPAVRARAGRRTGAPRPRPRCEQRVERLGSHGSGRGENGYGWRHTAARRPTTPVRWRTRGGGRRTGCPGLAEGGDGAAAGHRRLTEGCRRLPHGWEPARLPGFGSTNGARAAGPIRAPSRRTDPRREAGLEAPVPRGGQAHPRPRTPGTAESGARVPRRPRAVVDRLARRRGRALPVIRCMAPQEAAGPGSAEGPPMTARTDLRPEPVFLRPLPLPYGSSPRRARGLQVGAREAVRLGRTKGNVGRRPG